MRSRLELSEVLSACRKALAPLILFSVGINILMLTTSLYMLQVYDRVLFSHSLETLAALTGIAALALVAMAILEAVRARILVTVGSWLGRSLAPAALEAAVAQQAGWGQSAGMSALRDVEQLRNFLSGPTVNPLLDAPWAPIFLAVAFLIHPLIGIFALVGAVLLFILSVVGQWLTRDLLEQSAAAQRSINSEAEVALRSAHAMQAMGMLDAFIGQWRRNAASASKAHEKAGNRAGHVQALARFIRFGLQVGMLGLGALLVLDGKIDAGSMVAASIVMGRALAPLEQAIGATKAADGARAAYRRLKALAAASGPAITQLPLPRPEGNLRSEKLTLHLPEAGRPILDNISFWIGRGESLGIIGATASGKSSLARALVGVWAPTTGVVRLDSMDVSRWAPADRGQYIGYLPQEPQLVGRTVREAIARFHDIAAPGVAEAVIAAAQAAGLHETLKALPKGYETDIGQDGSYLSGGQRQRIGLARALFGDPALVVLDEPNAHLDRDGEESLIATIRALKARGCTTVIVAHRHRILENMDYLLVLEQGRVEHFGPRAEILAKLAVGMQPVPSIVRATPMKRGRGSLAAFRPAG